MKRISMILAAVFVAGAVQADPAMVGESAMGPVLTDAKGMALYTFDKDSADMSACSGGCAVNWPPLMAEAGAMAMGEWAVIARADGTRQWAYKGKPLYAWIKDAKPGDVTGDGVNGVWHVARP